jgi:cytidylate kinase
MVIAIDGPAGSGKSTIAKMLAENLKDTGGKGYTYINSGNLYRAITFGCLRTGIDISDSEKVINYAKNITITFEKDQVYLDGENVTNELHTDKIDKYTAPLSVIMPIRYIVNDLIRKLAHNMNVVVEGRDMTTVVFPDAKNRFYLDASSGSRAQRRFDQGTSGLSLEEVKKAILERDEIDKNKKEGSLIISEEVQYLDTSDLTIIQVYDKLIERLQKT